MENCRARQTKHRKSNDTENLTHVYNSSLKVVWKQPQRQWDPPEFSNDHQQFLGLGLRNRRGFGVRCFFFVVLLWRVCSLHLEWRERLASDGEIPSRPNIVQVGHAFPRTSLALRLQSLYTGVSTSRGPRNSSKSLEKVFPCLPAVWKFADLWCSSTNWAHALLLQNRYLSVGRIFLLMDQSSNKLDLQQFWGPDTVSESTASRTALSGFSSPQQDLLRELREILSAYMSEVRNRTHQVIHRAQRVCLVFLDGALCMKSSQVFSAVGIQSHGDQ